jgi:hypothetical protein
MRRSNWTPAIVPNEADKTVYLVADDFGKTGRAWREHGDSNQRNQIRSRKKKGPGFLGGPRAGKRYIRSLSAEPSRTSRRLQSNRNLLISHGFG